jgi:hypothetical protein
VLPALPHVARDLITFATDGRLLTVALDGEPVITEIVRSTNAEVAGLPSSHRATSIR